MPEQTSSPEETPVHQRRPRRLTPQTPPKTPQIKTDEKITQRESLIQNILEYIFSPSQASSRSKTAKITVCI